MKKSSPPVFYTFAELNFALYLLKRSPGEPVKVLHSVWSSALVLLEEELKLPAADTSWFTQFKVLICAHKYKQVNNCKGDG